MSFKTLNIGATALLTQRAALDTTGQNIANAATPGYARQRLQTEAARPEVHSFGALGSGVIIKQIKRVADEFLEEQVRIAASTEEYLSHTQDGYENLQVFFNELTEHDLSTMMNDFWDSASDLSNNVEDISTRRSLIEQAKSLRDAFQGMDDKIRAYRLQQNEAVVETINDINSYIAQIAELNADIVRTESGGTTGVVANDLRDQRGERIKDLSRLINVQVIEQPNGSFTVTHASRMLVFENQHFDLATRKMESDDMVIDLPVFADDEEEVEPTDGLLAAQADLRDVVLKSYQDDLDELAGGFIWEFNRLHTQNIGLKGFDHVLGTSSVVDPTVTLDNLQYDFTPVTGQYQIENGNFEIVVHDTVSGEDTVLNIEVDLDNRTPPDGDDDTILWDPANPGASNSLINKIQNAFDSVRPGLFTVGLDLANKLEITNLNNEYTFGFGRDTSGALAALGVNTFFDGYDGGSFDLNSVIESDPEMVGGAKSFTPGDNTGALALVELRDTEVMSNDTATLDDFYEGIVGRLGVEGARVESLLETQEDILTRMENQREDLSGVNMDEELTKMIQYQRSFQSAARFISTADVLYETLINM